MRANLKFVKPLILLACLGMLTACSGGGGGGGGDGEPHATDPSVDTPIRLTTQNAREMAGAFYAMRDVDLETSEVFGGNEGLANFASAGEPVPTFNVSSRSKLSFSRTIPENQIVSVSNESSESACEVSGSRSFVVTTNEDTKTTTQTWNYNECNDGQTVQSGKLVYVDKTRTVPLTVSLEYQDFEVAELVSNNRVIYNGKSTSIFDEKYQLTTTLNIKIENKSYNETYATSDYKAIYDLAGRTATRSGKISHSKYGSIKLANGHLDGEGSSLSTVLNGTVQIESNQSEPEYRLSLDVDGDNSVDFIAFVPESKLLGTIENTHSAPEVVMITPPEFLVNQKAEPDFVFKDKDFDFLSFKWSVDPAESAQVTNIDSSHPGFLISKVGAYKLKVIVNDQTQTVEKTFPVFFSSEFSTEMALPDILAGEKLTYQMQISQNSLDPYTFSIETAPPGTTVSPTGLITWVSDPSHPLGTESIFINATNSLHSYVFWGEFRVSAPTNNRTIALKSINFPVGIMPGDEVNFSLTTPDNSGTVKYELLSGPSGLSLDQAGNISWKAPDNDGYLPDVEYPLDVYVSSGDRFARYTVALTVHYRDRSMSAMAQGLTLVPMLSYSVADIDQNGKNELLISEDTNLVQAYSWNAQANKYTQSWFLPYSLSEDHSVRKTLAKTIKLADGKPGLVVTLGNTLYLLSDDLRTVINTKHLQSTSEVIRILVADLDQDGAQDVLLFQSDRHTTAMNQSMDVIWEATKAAYDGSSVAIANMDNDSELELAIGNTGIFSAKSGLQKWIPTGGLGKVVTEIDIDGDGIKEIADSVEPGKIRILSLPSKSQVSSINFPDSRTITALGAADFDKNGAEDLVASYDYETVTSWSFNNKVATVQYSHTFSNDYIYDLVAGDVNNDGVMDVVLTSSQDFSIGDGTLRVWTPRSDNVQELKSSHSVQTIQSAAFYPDKQKVHLGGRRSRHSENYTFDSFEKSGFDFNYEFEVSTQYASNFSIWDYDGNGINELLMGFSNNDAVWNLKQLDLTNGSTLWSSPDLANYSGLSEVSAISKLDYNGDGYEDVLIDSDRSVIGFDINNNENLFILEARNAFRFKGVLALNRGGANTLKIVTLSEEFGKQILDTYELVNGKPTLKKSENVGRSSTYPGSLYALSSFNVADVDGDGLNEVVLTFLDPYAHSDSLVDIYNSELKRVKTIQVSQKCPVDTILDGANILVAGAQSSCDGTFRFAAYSLATGKEVWRSPYLYGGLIRGGLKIYSNLGVQKQLGLATSSAVYFTQ